MKMTKERWTRKRQPRYRKAAKRIGKQEKRQSASENVEKKQTENSTSKLESGVRSKRYKRIIGNSCRTHCHGQKHAQNIADLKEVFFSENLSFSESSVNVCRRDDLSLVAQTSETLRARLGEGSFLDADALNAFCTLLQGMVSETEQNM